MSTWSTSTARAVNNATRTVAADRAGALAEVLKMAEATQPAAEDAAALRHSAAELGQFCDACEDMSDNQVPVLRWSPVRAYAGFSVVPLKPGAASCGSHATTPRPFCTTSL